MNQARDTIARELAQEAIRDALGGCAVSGGTMCPHIEPGASLFGLPGRILNSDEHCPLLTPDDRKALEQRIPSDMRELTGPAIVKVHGIAKAPRTRMASTALAGLGEHPDRLIERSGRYDGAV